MKIPSTPIQAPSATSPNRADSLSKSTFSELLENGSLVNATQVSFNVGSKEEPLLGGLNKIPGYLQGEEREFRRKRLDMLSLWGDIQAAESSRVHAMESQFTNKMAKELGLTKPFRLSSSWNEYVTEQPLMVANTDYPTVHPQSDEIRQYLDEHLGEVPELSDLISKHVNFVNQY